MFILIVSLAIFTLVIDTITMEVSMSVLANDLNADLSSIQSIITIYTLMKAAFMLLGAKLQNISGRKRTLVVGVAMYGVGTSLAAVSQNATMFLVGWSISEGIDTVLILLPSPCCQSGSAIWRGCPGKGAFEDSISGHISMRCRYIIIDDFNLFYLPV